MKTSYLKRMVMLVMSVMIGWTVMHGKEYCQEPITLGGTDVVLYSCIKTGETTYQIKIESDANIEKGPVNFYANPGGIDLGNKFELQGTNTLVVEFEAETAPTVYVSHLCVTVNGTFYAFNWPTDIEWSTTCGTIEPDPDDEEAPVNFTVSAGNITYKSIELLLSAEDNSGKVNFVISRDGADDITVNNVTSGEQKSYIVTGLDEDTEYTFSVIAKDATGNEAANNPQTITKRTIINQNTECGGESTEASQGNFETGYTYSFSTDGTNVTVEFEILDKKEGVVAHLWNTTSGFEEILNIPRAGERKFYYVFNNQVSGNLLKVACKFDYVGGMSVTKTFEYTVGNDCSSSTPLELSSIFGDNLTFAGQWNETEFSAILVRESINISSITSLDLVAVTGLDAKPAGLNANCLVYVDESVNITADNIVKVGTINKATSIVLTDNVPFNNTKEFTTSNINFSRTDLTAGNFSTLYLPFTIAKPTGMTAYSFAEVTGNKVRFTEVEDGILAANTAYLFKTDDNSLNLSTTNEAIFAVTIPSVAQINTFVGTFAEVIPTGDYYGYAGGEFMKGKGTKVIPFRAYLQGDPDNIASGAPARYSIEFDGGGATNLDINSAGDLVIISAVGGFEIVAGQAQQANLYSIDGRLVRSIKLLEGVNIVDGLSQGVYLMNNRKVMVK